MSDVLLADIRRAFDGVSIRGGVTLTEAYAIDNYEDAATRAAARAQDTYTRWTEVDVPRLDPGDSALSFVDPIGFHFHLPAYMSHAIRQNSLMVSGSIETEFLVFHFQVANDYGRRQTALFDHAQRNCCARFLVYLAEWRFSQECEFLGDMDRIAKEIYDDGSPLRVMRIAWWNDLTESERNALLARWPVLAEEPY